MKLIDAQALLQEHCFCLSPATKDYGSEWHKASCDECLKDGGFCGLEVSGDVIWNAPTIEAEQTKHGTWGENIYGYRKCSVCGRVTQVDECMREPLYLYCPYCGADMREVEK